MTKKVKIYFEIQEEDGPGYLLVDLEDFDGKPDEDQAQRMVDDHVMKNVVGIVSSFKIVER